MGVIASMLVAAAGAVAAVGLAFLPMKAITGVISRNIAAPIRQFVERQRDRRRAGRSTPDRRKAA